MSALGKKAVKAQADIAEVEKALSRTQQALHVVEAADVAAANAKDVAKRKGRPMLKLLILLTVVGIAVVVAKKVLGGGGAAPSRPVEVAPAAAKLDEDKPSPAAAASSN